ncbi:MAG: ATP-binding protein [Candidatus Promineifilaceae bacterium]
MVNRLRTALDFRRSLRLLISVTFGALAVLLTFIFGWLLDVSISERVDPQIFSQLQRLTFAYGVVLGIVFLVLGWVMAGRITRPLSRIADAARTVSQDEGEVVIPILPGQDEVASLSRSLNVLVADLNRQRAALQRSHAELEARVVERTRQLAALYEVLAAGNDVEADLPTVLTGTLERLLAATTADGGAIHLLDQAETRLTLAAEKGAPPTFATALEDVSVENALFSDILAQESYLYIPELTADSRTDPFSSQQENWQVLGIPIRKRTQNLGVLTLFTVGGDVLDESEIRLRVSLADHLAIIIENVELGRQAERLAVVEERNRLARELHDSVTQSLYSTTLFAEAGQRNARAGKLDKAMGYLAEVGETSQQALREMRLLVHKLRPSALDKAGLIPALEQRLKAVEERAGIHYELNVSGDLHLTADVEAALYFIAQEALNNALKHSQATAVTVQFLQEENAITLTVADNGCGFDTEAVQSSGGLGLTSIHERAGQFHGTVEIESAPGEGTTVTVCLPVAQSV